MNELAAIIPTYGKLDYALLAVRSLMRTVPGSKAFVIDDFGPEDPDKVRELEAIPGVSWFRFPNNRGLTRSWNEGLRLAREAGCRFTLCGNSDIVFSSGWYDALIKALNTGAGMVGPFTNAPGHQYAQDVRRYVPDYSASDLPDKIDAVSARLARLKKPWEAMRVNGFCMMAQTKTWWRHAYDSDNVFHTGDRYRMIRNEDEFQMRSRKRGLVTAAVPSSFVFHYRGVSRPGSRSGRSGHGAFRRS